MVWIWVKEDGRAVRRRARSIGKSKNGLVAHEEWHGAGYAVSVIPIGYATVTNLPDPKTAAAVHHLLSLAGDWSVIDDPKNLPEWATEAGRAIRTLVDWIDV